MTDKVNIDPSVAYNEATSLNEYYRNRNLILANQIAMLTNQLNNVTLERDKWLEEMQRLQLAAQEGDE